MATSPSCSSVGTSKDLEENDIFSDDSGVDIRPQSKNSEFPKALNLSLSASRRNKRKSTEPKRRKDVLQMKRFQWDTDEENDYESTVDGYIGSEVEDVFDVAERPSSGDSGCQVVILPQAERRKRQKKSENTDEEVSMHFAKPLLPASTCTSHRQSVIKKHEVPSAISSPDIPVLPNQKLLDVNRLIVQRSRREEFVDSTSETSIHNEAFDPDIRDSDLDVASPSSSVRSGGRSRNYKSMSRQRRIEANARERTRVHTISAAFESLRRAVPAYAHNQKLSKLAILRIASDYIVTLACLNDLDYSKAQNKPSLSECIDQCTRTIQAEGRSRRRSKN